jgi:hypothetical protein
MNANTTYSSNNQLEKYFLFDELDDKIEQAENELKKLKKNPFQTLVRNDFFNQLDISLKDDSKDCQILNDNEVKKIQIQELAWHKYFPLLVKNGINNIKSVIKAFKHEVGLEKSLSYLESKNPVLLRSNELDKSMAIFQLCHDWEIIKGCEEDIFFYHSEVSLAKISILKVACKTNNQFLLSETVKGYLKVARKLIYSSNGIPLLDNYYEVQKLFSFLKPQIEELTLGCEYQLPEDTSLITLLRPCYKSLKKLFLLERHNLNYSDMKSLERFTYLTSLNIPFYPFLGNTALESIEKLTQLTELNLKGNKFNTKLKELGKLTNLTSLDLHEFRYVPDEEFEFLKMLTNLISLKLFSCDGFNHKGMKGLSSLPNLKSLHIGGSGSNEKDLLGLEKLTNITELALTYFSPTEFALESIQGLTNLTSLNLCYCKQPIDLQLLKGLKKLSSLNLFHCFVTNAEHLKELTELTTLIGNEDINNLDDLKNLTQLTYLDLRHLNITLNSNEEDKINLLKTLTKLTILIDNNDV